MIVDSLELLTGMGDISSMLGERNLTNLKVKLRAEGSCELLGVAVRRVG
jgi:hypothetical protein